MTAVANAVRAGNGDPDVGTVADMDNYYRRFDQARLPSDCALVELDGAVVAYGRISWEDMANGEHLASGILNTSPAVRGGSIEGLLLEHAIDRANTLAVELGGGRDVFLGIAIPDKDPEQLAAAIALGFRSVRQFARLVRPNLDDIPDIPMPDGFEIRRIAADDRAMHRRVWEAGARAFDGSYGEEIPTENDYARWLEAPDFQPPLWRVAFHGEEIAAQILSFLDATTEPDGGRLGWTESISTQPEFRRRGLARALLADSLRAVRDAGATRAALGADLQNPNQAATLYQSMGFEIVSVSHEYRLGPFPRSGR
ncbi:MAG TPA: GNAT family N-acetyltransferase [Candidatus Limnocylindrales bacterium]